MIEEALRRYNFLNPQAELIRHNENMTYKVIDGDSNYLLRIHNAAEGLDFTLYYGNVSRNIYIESEI